MTSTDARATQAAGADTSAAKPAGDGFGGRPLFRDQAPEADGERTTTAEIDVSELAANSAHGMTRRAKSLLLGGGFVALLLVGGGGAFLVAANVTSDSGGGGSGPLEPGDVFPETVEVAGETYEMAITDDTENCGTATHGDFGDTLDENDCEQVIRASYVNEDQTHAVTVGVAAMGAPEDATSAREAQDLESSSWFAGLNGQEGSGAERMKFAGGHGSGAQWDRYLTFALASNTDGRAVEEDMDELTEIGDEFVTVPSDALDV